MVLALLKTKEAFLKIEFPILVMGVSILIGNNPNQYFSDYIQTLIYLWHLKHCVCVYLLIHILSGVSYT